MSATCTAESPAPCPCSLCPTFAAVALFINNARWDGVPFLLKAGKALANRRTEIRVQFRNVPGNLFSDRLSLNGMDLDRSTNELVCCCAFCACNAESTRAEHSPCSKNIIPLSVGQGGWSGTILPLSPQWFCSVNVNVTAVMAA